MKRKRNAADEFRGQMKLAEMSLLAPWVASRRLMHLGTLPAASAMAAWSAWSFEKFFAWSQVGARALGSVVSGAAPGAATTADILQPVRKRVKRNAHRRGHR